MLFVVIGSFLLFLCFLVVFLLLYEFLIVLPCRLHLVCLSCFSVPTSVPCLPPVIACSAIMCFICVSLCSMPFLVFWRLSQFRDWSTLWCTKATRFMMAGPKFNSRGILLFVTSCSHPYCSVARCCSCPNQRDWEFELLDEIRYTLLSSVENLSWTPVLSHSAAIHKINNQNRQCIHIGHIQHVVTWTQTTYSMSYTSSLIFVGQRN